ncbi:serine-rich adhesin for platelets-like [Eurosta solidaginis]|uniref:serine-rich adhesin for platelets-like n=1 Tax=Eurosta solidaginis TaxID=178769 RepID=UPI003531265D
MKCELCGSARQNSVLYGEFLKKSGKGVHTHCLYLSSGLKQSGKDNEGILGFLPSDIAAERKRVATIQCIYCGKMRANIGCCKVRCYRNFHMICGIDNGAMNQFLYTFRSFCDRHVRKVPTRPKPTENCYICYESLFAESKRFRAVNIIRAPCCKNGWFHKYCLQKFAKSSGYFFKCPLCNDCEKFKAHMSFWGIFVYDKDAEWELVPNAFAELLERPRVCRAEICHNKRGREQHNSTTNPLVYCTTCGSVAVHRSCVRDQSNTFDCENCKQILSNADSGRESLSSQQQNDSQDNECSQIVQDTENLDIDVCDSDSEVEINKNTQENGDLSPVKDNILRRRQADEDDEVIIPHNSYKSETAKLHVNKAERSEIVGESNTLNCNINEVINDDKNKLNCSKTVKFRCIVTDSDYSGDEGLIDTADSRKHVKATRTRISTTQTQTHDIHNITTCIAQRTRRKSMAFRPPSLDEPLTNSSDDVYNDASIRINSYTAPKSYQVFQYDDDGNDDVAQNASMEETEGGQEYGSADPIKDDSINENTSLGEDDSESVYGTMLKPQSTVEIVKDEKDANFNRNSVTNPLDVSCIANRTRRRSSIKIQSSVHNSATVDIDDKQTIPTTSKNSAEKRNAFIYEEGCEYIEIERENNCSPVEDDVTNKKNGQIRTYFLKILSEVKNNTNANLATRTNKNREDVTKNNHISNDPLNTSCIASRTRRRSIHTNIIQSLNEEQNEMESNTYVFQRDIGPIVINGSNNSVIDGKSIDSNSTSESFNSSTYFGKTVKTENFAKSDNEREINDCNPSKRCEASSSKDIQQTAQKRKCIYDTKKPTKITALCAEHNTTRHANDLSLNYCNEICEQHEHMPSVTTNETATPQALTSIITISLIDSSPESNGSDIICLDTPTQESTIEHVPSIERPCTPTTTLFTNSSMPSNPRRGERLRGRPRRVLNIYNEHAYAKPSRGHSPTDNMAHWSSLKEKVDPYIMPRYVRINGKLRRVPAETALQHQQQANGTPDAQTHFTRSYNLLLHTTNDHSHASSSCNMSNA